MIVHMASHAWTVAVLSITSLSSQGEDAQYEVLLWNYQTQTTTSFQLHLEGWVKHPDFIVVSPDARAVVLLEGVGRFGHPGVTSDHLASAKFGLDGNQLATDFLAFPVPRPFIFDHLGPQVADYAGTFTITFMRTSQFVSRNVDNDSSSNGPLQNLAGTGYIYQYDLVTDRLKCIMVDVPPENALEDPGRETLCRGIGDQMTCWKNTMYLRDHGTKRHPSRAIRVVGLAGKQNQNRIATLLFPQTNLIDPKSLLFGDDRFQLQVDPRGMTIMCFEKDLIIPGTPVGMPRLSEVQPALEHELFLRMAVEEDGDR